MKKLSLLCVFILVAALFGGCSPAGGALEPVETGLPLVYTSFYPMYDFTCKLAGDKAEVINLVPTGTEPHDWEPTPRDIAGLEAADMLVYNGAGLEHWVSGILSSLSNDHLVAVETSAGLSFLEGGEEEHDHHEDEDDEEDDHDHGIYDPHVWLSPARAKLQMEAICTGLIQVDPDNEAYYRENLDLWSAEFDTLDGEFRSVLEPLPNKTIVVAHKAFAYLCADYGLTQVSAKGFSPDQEPEPAQMARTVEFCKENKIKVIFFEELTSSKVAEVIAAETGAETGVLSPLEGLSEESLAAGEDYFAVMRRNLSALEYALS